MEIRSGKVVPTTLCEKIAYSALDPHKSPLGRAMTRVGLIACGFLAAICTLGIALPWIIRCSKDYSLLDNKIHEIARRLGIAATLPPAIRISCEEEGGMGDEAFAMKLYKIVKKCMAAEGVEVSLTGMSEREEGKFAKLDRSVSLMPLETMLQHADEEHTLLIHGPVPRNAPKVSELTTEIWQIAEYSGTNASREPYERSGPGVDELGIFCDKELYEAGQSLFERGERADPAALDLLENEDVKKRLKENGGHRFFGYAHNRDDIVGQFAKDLVPIIKSNDENVDVCLVSPWIYDKGKDKRFAKLRQAEVVETFKSLDRCIEVWMIDPITGALQKTEEVGEGEKKVRLFFIDRLTHSDFVNVMKASQPYTLITGDQSLSEALSLGKVVFYETLGGKENLKKNLIQVAEEQGLTKLKKVLAREEDIDLTDPDLVTEARAFTDYLYKERNLEKTITKRVQEWLKKVRATRGS